MGVIHDHFTIRRENSWTVGGYLWLLLAASHGDTYPLLYVKSSIRSQATLFRNSYFRKVDSLILKQAKSLVSHKETRIFNAFSLWKLVCFWMKWKASFYSHWALMSLVIFSKGILDFLPDMCHPLMCGWVGADLLFLAKEVACFPSCVADLVMVK